MDRESAMDQNLEKAIFAFFFFDCQPGGEAPHLFGFISLI
jgi:hypothetical protein